MTKLTVIPIPRDSTASSIRVFLTRKEAFKAIDNWIALGYIEPMDGDIFPWHSVHRIEIEEI